MELTAVIPAESQLLLARVTLALGRARVYGAVFKLFERVSLLAAGYIVKTKLSGQSLGRRTGALARSMTGAATRDKDGLPGFRVGVFRGPALKYAGIMEHGTKPLNPESPYSTILPVRARYLAMPVGEALTGAGVGRFGSPRDFPGRLVFIPFRSSGVAAGGLYDAASLRRAGGGPVDLQSARLLWVLLRKLDLKPHHYLRDGMREYLPQVASALGTLLRDLLAGRVPV